MIFCEQKFKYVYMLKQRRKVKYARDDEWMEQLLKKVGGD